jgi:multicomponent Na+:H+ antiporter subunit E
MTGPDTRPSIRSPARRPRTHFGKRGAAPFVLTFLIMALFWVVLSGKFDPFHLSLGMISCLVVAALGQNLLFPVGVNPSLFIFSLRFIGYIPWLLFQIFRANLHVLRIVFHPKMMDLIDPHVIEFESNLKSDVARTTFANSITLTPGTITIDVSALGLFSVHCIDQKSGQALPGEMASRIDKVFGE